MQNFNLRQAIVMRVQDKSDEELTDIIASSVNSDEKTLPGLGVLFEMIWQESDKKEQDRMVQSLNHHLQSLS